MPWRLANHPGGSPWRRGGPLWTEEAHLSVVEALHGALDAYCGAVRLTMAPWFHYGCFYYRFPTSDNHKLGYIYAPLARIFPGALNRPDGLT